MMVGNSEKHNANTCRMHYPPSNTTHESRDATWLHMFCYSPQPGINFDIKAGESTVPGNDARNENLDVVDDTVENNANIVENNSENENSEESEVENNDKIADNNKW